MHESQLDRYSLTVVHNATAVADLGEKLGAPPSLFWLKEEEIKEKRRAGRVIKTTPP